MIKVTCPHCGLTILVPDSIAGNRGVCFRCGRELIVPTQHPPATDLLLPFAKGEHISDRYEIEERLGKGGMGVVYRAQDHLMNEPVALKFINPRLLRTRRGQQLFIQEAQVARRLRHEHIVGVHDVGRTPKGVLYISMELLAGRSLREYLRKRRTERRFPPVRFAVDCISQVLGALEYAHKTVVHRDIKPENVMLLPGEQLKVLDFGLAKAVENEEALDAQEGSTRPVGTTAYAAPEQKAHHDVDLRADIYSVGLVFHELLTLRTPIDEAVAVADVRDDVAPGLLTVLDKALRQDRELRYPSAAEFREALDAAYRETYLQSTRPVSSVPGSRREANLQNMVFLEGGSFLMGSSEAPEEAPEFEAEVEAFYIDAYPVTNREFAVFLKDTGRDEPKFWRHALYNGPEQPVAGVTWAEAQAYAAWAGKELPTERQWEYAARGKQNRRYPWGNQEPDPTRCNYGEHLNMPSIITMHEEGCTPEGVFDLAGNLDEWTQSPYQSYEAGGSVDEGETGPLRKVVRGGSWRSSAKELRCSARRGLFPESQLPTVGFRCVVAYRSTGGGDAGSVNGRRAS
jgi:formylglycine-generating enzyme required for sulfatase activity